MSHRALCGLLAATLSLASPAGAQAREPAERPGGEIRGHVRGVRQAPIAEALVLLCDAVSGLPLGAETRAPFLASRDDGKLDLDGWWFARTDERGAFVFEGVPAGDYRLVAQSWPDVERPDGFEETNGLTLHLRGIAEGVRVPSAQALELRIDPLGEATFAYHRGASNDGWHLVLSAAPTAADPVLGFLGWRGDFLRQSLAYVRMPAGHALVRGLPSGELHYALFANDSRPGFGAGSFWARRGEITARDTNLVTGWSDAIHDPPKRLQPLVAEVSALGREGLWEVILSGHASEAESLAEVPGFARLFRTVDLVGPLTREITLDSGARASLGDLLAADGYLGLAASPAR